jgi:diguanylate cyclase (GGDEF)-like protein
LTIGGPAERGSAPARHFSGSMTKYLVDYLRDRGRAGELDEVLLRAGESRSAEELADESSWSTYAEFRRLLEAAALVLGDRSRLALVGPHATGEISTPELVAGFLDLGSPAQMYDELTDAAATMSTIVTLASRAVGPTEYLVEERFQAGFDPFPEYCSYAAGLIAVPPQLFGLPPAEVVEERCQTEGAPSCVFRVRWTAVDDLAGRAEYFERRSQVLEARLQALQETVSDVVHGGDLREVLARIVSFTARAVSVPGYLLVVDALPLGGRWTHVEGVPADAVAGLAAALPSAHAVPGAPPGLDHVLAAADVVSKRGRYGHLLAVGAAGRRLFPQEHAVLSAHARLVAAALDSAEAVDEARRQAATAEALLTLAASLAEIGSTQEMADRVARAMPAVLDCDHAVVVLAERDPQGARVAGAWGYTEEMLVAIRQGPVPPAPPGPAEVGSYRADPAAPEASVARGLADSGMAALATVPFRLSGDAHGWIVVGVVERAERLLGDTQLSAKLLGVAAQVRTAISNARLLDQVRHQALHDHLTGLPNRSLILDRAEHLLARAAREDRDMAAFFIDLDNFKDINDSLGHDTGDELLRQVGARFAAAMRKSDTVGRLGGDEFIVLTDTSAASAGPEVVVERLQLALAPPFVIPGFGPLTASASVGVAVGRPASVQELLRNADIALYRAKGAGRNTYVVFRSDMEPTPPRPAPAAAPGGTAATT